MVGTEKMSDTLSPLSHRHGNNVPCNFLEGTAADLEQQRQELASASIHIAPTGEDNYCTYLWEDIPLGPYRQPAFYTTLPGDITNQDGQNSVFHYFPQQTTHSEGAKLNSKGIAEHRQYLAVAKQFSDVLGDTFDRSVQIALQNNLGSQEAVLSKIELKELARDPWNFPKVYRLDLFGWNFPESSNSEPLEKPLFASEFCANWIWPRSEGDSIPLAGWDVRRFENGTIKAIPAQAVRLQYQNYLNKGELYGLAFQNDLDQSPWLNSKDPVRFRLGEATVQDGGIVGLECPIVTVNIVERPNPGEQNAPRLSKNQRPRESVPPPVLPLPSVSLPPSSPPSPSAPSPQPPVASPFDKELLMVEFEKKLGEIAKDNGGELQRYHRSMAHGNDPAELIKKRLPLEEKKSHYQMVVVVDASGSMTDDVQRVKAKAEEIFKLAKDQLKSGGQVSIGIRFYVDDIYGSNGTLEWLDSEKVLKRRAEEREATWSDKILNFFTTSDEVADAKEALTQVVNEIYSRDGSIEYHWEALMNALKQEEWASNDQDVEKVLFLITDEDEDGGRNIKKYKREEVIAEAKRLGVRTEVIVQISQYESCFQKTAYLRTQQGATITFGQLAEMQARGEELPFIAAYNAYTSAVVYQKPKKIIERSPEGQKQIWLNLEVKKSNDDKAALVITSNHRLLARREGKEQWIQSGELRRGDEITNPNGTAYRFDSSHMERGAFDVYNLSFGSNKSNGLANSFLVSLDGQDWFVTHSQDK